MTDKSDFQDLIERSGRGDAAAISELISRYEPEVRIVARARLGAPMRPYLDSVDIVQSMHRSLLIGLRENRFAIETPQQLIALAHTIVRRKVARHWRRLRRQKRLSGENLEDLELAGLLLQLTNRELDPHHSAELSDSLAAVLSQLSSTEQELIQLRLEGFSTTEAARRLKLDPDVTRVRLSRLRKKLASAGVKQQLI